MHREPRTRLGANADSGGRGSMTDGSDGGTQALRDIDASVPHSARIWNYWLGGKDNFQADR